MRKAITISLNEAETQRLNSLTYSYRFGTNRSAFIRALIERAWQEHRQQEEKQQKEQHGTAINDRNVEADGAADPGVRRPNPRVSGD